MRLFVTLLSLPIAVAVLLAGAPAGAQVDGTSAPAVDDWTDIPETFRGFYSSNCGERDNAILFTGFDRFYYAATDEGYTITPLGMHQVEQQDDRTLRVKPGPDEDDHILQKDGDRLLFLHDENADPMQECKTLPPGLAVVHGEGIRGILALDRVLASCRSGHASTCRQAVLKLGDVSDNGKWSVAEIARLFRIVLYLGEVTRTDTLVYADDAVRSSILSLPFAPVVIRMTMNSFDYDNDGELSMGELLQDRRIGTFGAAQAMKRVLPAKDRIQDTGSQLRTWLDALSSLVPGRNDTASVTDPAPDPDGFGDQLNDDEDTQIMDKDVQGNLSDSEIVDLRRKLASCWSPPVGARDAENLKIDIRMRLNRDGSIESAQLLSRDRMDDAFYRAAAESAMRAVRICSPYSNLPSEKYDDWQTLDLTFDPQTMLRN